MTNHARKTEPKLLTNADVVRMAPMNTNQRAAFLRERGLIAPEPEPVDALEAAEASAKAENEALKNTLRQRNDELHCGLARIAELKAETAALAERVKVLSEAAFRAEQLLRRYRTETHLGHQPHMIAHQADEALSGIKAALAGETP